MGIQEANAVAEEDNHKPAVVHIHKKGVRILMALMHTADFDGAEKYMINH